MRTRTRMLVSAALLASLLAASALLTVPIGEVPVTLQVFVVLVISLLLPPGWALWSVLVYLLLGAVGLPVFAGGLAGPGVLVGPTGGYLIGFALGACAGSWVFRAVRSTGSRLAAAYFASCGTCIAVLYLAGWAQLQAVAGIGPAAAFATGVAPFIAFDVAKAVVAAGVADAVRRAGYAPPDGFGLRAGR